MLTYRLGRSFASPRRFSWWKRIQRTNEVSPGGEASLVSGVMTDTRRVPGVRCRLSYRYAHELACCYFLENSALEANAMQSSLGCTKEVMDVGWWKTVSGAVIGDGPANVLDEYTKRGAVWADATVLPSDVRKQVEALYVEDLGRLPTEEELEALLSFCQ